MTTDLKLPELPEPWIPKGRSWTIPVAHRDYYTAEQMQERDKQIVELCASIVEHQRVAYNWNEREALAKAIRALKTEEVHLTARSGMPSTLAASPAAATPAQPAVLQEAKPTYSQHAKLIEAVEDEVGMGHGAWDCVAPEELVAAVLKCAAIGVDAGKQEPRPKA